MHDSSRWLLLIIFLTIGFTCFIGIGGVAADAGNTTTESVEIDDAVLNTHGETTVIVRLDEIESEVVTASADPVSDLKTHATRSQQPVHEFAESTPGVAVEKEFWITNAVVVTLDTDRVPVERLTEIDGVTRIHENFEVEITAATPSSPGSPASGDTSTVEPTTTGSHTYGLNQINVPTAWDEFDTQGAGTAVAVLDTGIDDSHPDLPELTDEQWQEFDVDGETVASEPNDGNGHGTHVSGTIVGSDNPADEDIPAYGVAPDATLYHAKVFDDDGGGGTFARIIAGMEWAVEDTDVDVISMSLGTNSYAEDFITPVQTAHNAGVIVIASSGNDGHGESSSPGNVYDATAVGASTEADTIASFSSGELVNTDDAWGDDAPTEWPAEYYVPDVAAPGEDVISAIPGDEYTSLDGTSMAAPHVSGTIALLLSEREDDLTPDEIEDVLTSTTRELPNEGADRQGAGEIDAYAALRWPEPTARLASSTRAAVEVGTETVTFDAGGSVTATDVEQYEWFINGEAVATTDDPIYEHVFDDIGEQTVAVTVTDTDGNDHTSTLDIGVVDTTPPEPVLTISPEHPIPGDTLTFDASNSTDNHEIETYAFDFDDGNTTSGDEPVVEHTYAEEGEYDVSLTVTDASGNEETLTKTIDVGVTEPTAVIAANETSNVEVGLQSVAFDASESTDDDGIEEYQWAVDGDVLATTTEPTYTHVFDDIGTRNVSVTVVNVHGVEDTAAIDIDVVDTTPPSPAVTVAPTEVTVGQSVTVDASNSTDNHEIETYTVAFGDGQTETTAEPIVTHEYNDTGEYQISLTATDPSGNAETITETVTVQPTQPTAAVTANRTADIEINSDAVAFDASESTDEEGIEYYQWAINGEEVANTTTPTYTTTFDQLDEQTVSVTVGNVFGVEDTAAVGVDVVDTIPPTAVVELNRTETIVEEPISATAGNSTDNHEIDSYLFEFGDSTTQSGVTATHAYESGGSYPVNVTVTDPSGNDDTATETVTVSTPNVTITDPTDGSLQSGTPVTVEYLLSETHLEFSDGLQYRVLDADTDSPVIEWADGEFNATKSGEAFSIPIGEELSDGTYTIELRIVDSDGNQLSHTAASDSVTVSLRAGEPFGSVTVDRADPDFPDIGPNNHATLTATIDDPFHNHTTLQVKNETTTVQEWNITAETGSNTSAVREWNATDELNTVVASGDYEIRSVTTDTFGQEYVHNTTASVDTVAPRVTANVAGGLRHDGRHYLNASSSALINVTAHDGHEKAITAPTLTLRWDRANYRVTPTITEQDSVNYTATVSGTQLGQRGDYTATVTAVDGANNKNQTTAKLAYDNRNPTVTTTVTDFDAESETATVRVRASEKLITQPTITHTAPDGTESQLTDLNTVTPDRVWNGTISVTDGQHVFTGTGTDRAGNSAADTANLSVTEPAVDNGTVLIYDESTGMFINATVTGTETDRALVSPTETSPYDLAPSEIATRHLSSVLGPDLAGNLTEATIGIPATAEATPAEFEPDAGEIRRYDPETETWQTRSTTLEHVTISDENVTIDGEYWTTTTENFSTYSVLFDDEQAPSITDRSPADGETLSTDTETVPIDIQYTDGGSGVNVSAVSLAIDGNDVTDADTTQVTETGVVHDSLAVDAGESYTIALTLEDEAGNSDQYEWDFSVANDVEEDDNNDEDTDGNGGSDAGQGSGQGGGGVPVGTTSRDEEVGEDDEVDTDDEVDEDDEVEVDDNGEIDTDDTTPGFGTAVTVITLVVAALLAARRGN